MGWVGWLFSIEVGALFALLLHIALRRSSERRQLRDMRLRAMQRQARALESRAARLDQFSKGENV